MGKADAVCDTTDKTLQESFAILKGVVRARISEA